MANETENKGAAAGAEKKPKALNLLGMKKLMDEQVGATNDRMDSFEAAIGDLSESVDQKMDAILASLSGMNAQDRPTGSDNPNRVESEEVEQPLDVAEFDGPQAGPAALATAPTMSIVEANGMDMEDPGVKDWMSRMAFNEERLEIEITEVMGDDDQIDQAFSIAVNGINWLFHRGRTYDNIPRYIVEGIARAKPHSFGNKEVTDANGVKRMVYPRSMGLRYPFSILHDPNPLGREWFKSLLMERQ